MLNIYRASAGSGKTFQLTKEYIIMLFAAMLKENFSLPHRRILAVTFTNKATDEMKSRILKELHALKMNDKSPYRADLMSKFKLTDVQVNEIAEKILIAILHDYSFFSISTIDKFFLQIIRSFAREIGVNGGYNVELDNKMTLQQALENMYNSLSVKENQNLLQWMTDFLQEKIEDGKSRFVDKSILKFGEELFKENYQHKAKEIKELLNNKEFLHNYRKKLKAIRTDFEEKVSVEVENALNTINNYGLTGKDFYGKKLENNLKKIGIDKNYDLSKNTTIEKFAGDVETCWSNDTSEKVKDAIRNAYNNGLGENLRKIVKLITQEIAPYNSAIIILKNINTLGIMADLADHISQLTSEKNIMLLANSNMLLNDIIGNSNTPFVYERTGINIDHYMIDEFQDTSALQWENFKPLIENSLSTEKANLLVGDVKQSIYRWRNSDWKLLASQAMEDFKNLGTDPKSLDTNWRSDKNIILFNNNLFKSGAEKLQEKYSSEIENALQANPELEKLNNKIANAYSDVVQKISDDAGIGHVRLEFVAKEDKDKDWADEVLDRIPSLVENLVEKGYKHSDIAFLVRTNKEAKKVTEFMLNYKNSADAKPGFSYNIVGNEGLMLTSSSSVNFITSTLSFILDPSNEVARANMLFEYKLSKPNHFTATDLDFDKSTVFSTFFTEEENACLEEISHLSLYEAVEKLISDFKIEKWHGETVFLQAFQDVVYKFSNNNNADLSSFIKWWNDNGDKQKINTPENEQAFRIMTVHSSKGLDFKVVIVPFCNWDMQNTGTKAPLLWCETEVAPFNELPLLPVMYEKKLASSIFSKDYFEELLHQYVDNLNIAYVGFTRARNEMYIFAEAPSNSVNNLSCISDLMYVSLTENTELAEFWNEDKTILEIGEPTTAVYKEKKSDSISKKLSSYPIVDSSERLKIKHTSKDYWKTTPISASRVNYGTLMHEILQKTILRGDEEKAVSELLTSGRISESDLPRIQQELKQFWSQAEVNEWFSKDAEILNECAILLPSGEMYRPDRVVLNGIQATVIDYKFGEEEHGYHKRQLQRYTDFLKEMGYSEVKGKLYYVSLGKIEDVQ